MPRPLTIGLTGAVAAGKSEALAALGRLGASIISSDAIVHDLLGSDEVRRQIRGRWGDDVISGGEVDRTRVGEAVFADPAELAWLEALLHPLVGDEIACWLTALPGDTEFAAVEVPLLFEGAMADGFDTTIAVVTSDEVRRARAGARGHALVGERESRQLSQAEKAARAAHVVVNEGSVEDLERTLGALLDELRSGAPAPGGLPG